MYSQKLQAWWWYQQGLGGDLAEKTPREVLLRTGWSRSIGGANPYLNIFTRSGASFTAINDAVAESEVMELPSARGCTYVLPRDHFKLGLTLAGGTGESAEIKNAKRFLGVTDDELTNLSKAVLSALKEGPLEPLEIKKRVGDASRNLGDEGKKRGMSTTLPLITGQLQISGKIKRVPESGRLDRQRYRYELWVPSPLQDSQMTMEEANAQLAWLFYNWMGPATVESFKLFAGITGIAASAAISKLGLVSIPGDQKMLLFPEQRSAFQSFEIPSEPSYSLLASLDSLLANRRELQAFVAPEDMHLRIPSDKGTQVLGEAKELWSNPIIDRGRIIGLWEYEPHSSSIVWTSFIPRNALLVEMVERTESFIRDQLGDCRSFSLDSPESRQPRLDGLRQMAETETVTV